MTEPCPPELAVEALGRWLHARHLFDHDYCDHGTYTGGPSHGQPYAMCEREAQALFDAVDENELPGLAVAAVKEPVVFAVRVGGRIMPATFTQDEEVAQDRASNWPGAYKGLAEVVPLYLGNEPVRSERLPAPWDGATLLMETPQGEVSLRMDDPDLEAKVTDALIRAAQPAVDPDVAQLQATELERARAAHQRCLDKWEGLTDEVRAGTTFHGVEAHLTVDRSLQRQLPDFKRQTS